LNSGYLGSATSNASGVYSVKGIPTGSYKVGFFLSGSNGQQWYAAKGSFASATTVTVTAPSDTPSINAALGYGPAIWLSAYIKDYGTVNVATTSTKSFYVYNYGTGNLTIGTLSITGNSFAILNDRCSGKTLSPSAYCTIQVSFTPTTAGAKSETVNIPSNDPVTAVIGISVTGTGSAPNNAPNTSNILWRNLSTGDIRIWYMNGAQVVSDVFVGTITDQNW
jgi:hypothetical protein